MLLERHAGDLKEHLDGAHDLVSKRNDKGVPDLITPALERVNKEIDYALLSAQGEDQPHHHDTVVIVHQRQGIVQTGAGSIANLSIGPDERRRVAEA